eukprot:Gregarina_sp_Pseudo_9__2019@NODE_239_length_3463_cov_686_558119_g223_i0_p2_GENE_NODE_239_length_3463_cov_686_558119_g223_i0NODE_239_length_3463_cov_686_558119_g223_i0_p2_ORF_typecomplete_len492_score65_61Reprolysin_3/PF13582_6/0_00029Peptidase_M66/PF10462_9/0_00035Reprolysin_4/PF13583_6/0_00047Reprolysin_4/PF13583_6/4_5e03Peptidase_M11/PF05548_11/0_0019Reprolysin_5/PF13688_6/0_02Reprolysin_5/PF13688_6/4e03Peptidase_M54/PF07998_11/0_18_NODE_239_length_3463_cov_686_558119_g223_i018243299
MVIFRAASCVCILQLAVAVVSKQKAFSASVAELLADKPLSNVALWSTEVHPDISSIGMLKQSEKPLYKEVYGELLDAESNYLGETFLLQHKTGGRSINLNILSTGEAFMFVQDSTSDSGAGLTIKKIPKLELAHDAADKAMKKLMERSSQKPHLAARDFEWGFDVALPEGEKDDDGLYVLDGLFIFSRNAVLVVNNDYGITVDEFVELNLLMITMAWRNSGIDEVKTRVVSTQVWDQDVAVSVDNFYWVKEYTQQPAEEVGADYVAYFTNGTQFGPGEVGGLGGVEDPYTLVLITGVVGWRHEIGHNAGMNHCWAEDDGFGYRHGWELSMLQGPPGTIMCGNSISLFSSPTLYVHGVQAGDPEKADATRHWHDAIPPFSGQREHLVPFDGEKPTWVLNGVMTKNSDSDNIVEWNVVEDTHKMIFKTHSVDTWDPTTEHGVWINSDCCPGIYYGQHFEAVAHLLIMPCPAVGNWVAYISGSGPTNYTIEMYA